MFFRTEPEFFLAKFFKKNYASDKIFISFGFFDIYA